MKRLKIILFILMIVFLLIIVSIFIYYSYLRSVSSSKESYGISKQNQVIATKEILDRDLNTTVSDLLILSSHKELSSYLTSYTSQTKISIEEEFKKFIEVKGVYDQARYIDEEGQEIIRVNLEDGQANLSSEDELQNKSDRYYFQRSMAMQKEEVYISPFDLNVENGQIEEPYTPMIRIATKVYDGEYEKGIIIINYIGNQLIQDFQDISFYSDSQTSLINNEGYWLIDDDPSKRWGFMFDEKINISLKNENKEIWDKIIANDSGQFYREEGLYTYDTIYPLAIAQYNDSLTTEEDPYYWKILDFVPNSDIYSKPKEILISTLELTILFMIIGIIGASFLSNAIVNNYVANRRIRSLNSSLKLINKTLRHDVLNNLTAIKYNVEIAEDSEQEDQYISSIKQSAHRAIKVINEMRQLEANLSTNIELNQMEVKETMKEIIENYKDEIRINIKGNATIKVDNGFRSVIENIIRNTITHANATELNIDVEKGKREIRISLSDDGIGIPEEIKPQLFDQGFKYGKTGNTGLGLYIVKETMKRYGGKVEVKDNTPKGTKFILIFPK